MAHAVDRRGARIASAHGILERQTRNMMRMVDDLLDVSRVTHGKIRVRPEPTDLAELLRRCVEATHDERRAARQVIEADIPAHPVWVLGDPLRLEQAICNLLHNATKFTRLEGAIWLALGVEEGPGKRNAVIRVRDNGMGIEPAVLPRIFELFVQDDRSSERARSGIGLGLTLAKRLVELHGGTIEASSAGASLGSEFVVRLPLMAGTEASASRAPARKRSRVAITPRRVLIVDDNADSAESLRLVLVADGHTVETAADGTSALTAAARFKPEVVLLDIALPDMDGYRVAEGLRKAPKGETTLIIAVTGYAGDESVRRSREAGIDEHLVKPLDPDRLTAILQRGRGKG